MSQHFSLRGVVNRTLMVVILAVLAATPAPAQESELSQIATSLARNVNAGNRHTITVADFTDLQGNVTELGRFIAEELSTQLVMQAKSFSVVERIQLAAILKEHQISVSGLVDPATIRKLGQFAGVDAIITGTLVPFADSVHLTAKVLDVSTAKVMAVSAADLPRTKTVDDLLSRGISSGATVGPKEAGGTVPPQKGPKLLTFQQNELLLAIKSCTRHGGALTCLGSVTNKSEKPRQLQLDSGRGYTSAVDNDGNSYDSERTGFGEMNGLNGYSQIQLMPDLPVNFFLAFPPPDQSASTVTVVLAYQVEGARDSLSKAVFRNIPISQK